MADDTKIAPVAPVAPVTAPEPAAPRIDNPFVPGQSYEAPPGATAATVVKLWAGGEHRNAMDLADALKLSAADVALVRASCPGWDELRGQ